MIAGAEERALDAVFHALASQPRRQILGRLKDGPTRVTDMAEHFDFALNTVSKHIKVLERAGLIRREVRGRVHLCHANEARLAEAEEWIHHYREFWSNRLDRLEAFLNSPEEGKDNE